MKKYTKIIGLSIIAVLLLYQTISLFQVKRDLVNLQQDNDDVRLQVLELINSINQNIQSTIYEEIGRSHLTKDVSFSFNKNIDGGHNLDVRAELSKVENDSKVLFMYKDESEKNWKEIELKKSSELSYIGNIDLPYGNQYEYKVVVSNTNSESSEIGIIDKSEFIPREPDVSYGWSDNEISLTAYTYNDYENSEDAIKGVDMIIGFNGKEKLYSCEYKTSENNVDGDTYENNYYEVNIPKKDYENKFEYVKMKVTYNNGVVDVVDISDRLGEINN